IDSGPSPSATMATPLPLKTGLDQPTLCFSPPALTVSRTASLAPSLPSTASTATRNRHRNFRLTKTNGTDRDGRLSMSLPSLFFLLHGLPQLFFRPPSMLESPHASSVDAHPRKELLGDHCRFINSRRRAGIPQFRSRRRNRRG